MRVLVCTVVSLVFVSITHASDFDCGKPLGIGGDEHDGKCYDYAFDPLNWRDAESCCQRNGPGSHLVNPRDSVLNSWIQSQGGNVSHWIGLSRDTAGRLVWTDTPHEFNTTGFAGWLSGEPSSAGQCVAMTAQFSEGGTPPTKGWAMRDCDSPLPYICVTPEKCRFPIH